MKFYVSAKGIKGVTISNSSGGGGGFSGKGSAVAGLRRISHRAVVLPVVLVVALLLPFLFFRTAFLVLESATNICSSSLDCMGWRFSSGNDGALLREELTRALLEANDIDGKSIIEEGTNSIPESFMDLVKDMTSNGQDIKAFAFKTKAMMLKMEHLVQAARRRELVFWHIASHSLPKSLHCLSLKLAQEFAVNAMARSLLPPPEFLSRLTDHSFHHVVLLTDNVLAASVAISSATKSSINPEKLMFHIVTDKKTYTAMHAWFSVNSITSAVVEVKGLHQYDWPHEVNIEIKEMLEIHRLIWRHRYDSLKAQDFEHDEGYEKNLEVLQPSCFSLLNHLRIYLPEMFPDLNKILFLDDDIVVQRDLSSLWDLDLNGKVIGAVIDSWCGHNCCPGRKYKDYFNFTNPIISSSLDFDCCGWLYGMNVFDLQAWRKTNITATYHQWLRQSLISGFELWRPGALPPALIAFEGHVHEIDPSWHMAGLGFRNSEFDTNMIKTAAVIHFSGPAKPWLEVAAPELRRLWYRHVNFSNESVRKCGITG